MALDVCIKCFGRSGVGGGSENAAEGTLPALWKGGTRFNFSLFLVNFIGIESFFLCDSRVPCFVRVVDVCECTCPVKYLKTVLRVLRMGRGARVGRVGVGVGVGSFHQKKARLNLPTARTHFPCENT